MKKGTIGKLNRILIMNKYKPIALGISKLGLVFNTNSPAGIKWHISVAYDGENWETITLNHLPKDIAEEILLLPFPAPLEINNLHDLSKSQNYFK